MKGKAVICEYTKDGKKLITFEVDEFCRTGEEFYISKESLTALLKEACGIIDCCLNGLHINSPNIAIPFFSKPEITFRDAFRKPAFWV